MNDNEITAIVGWPTLEEMENYRKVAAAAESAERERCAKLCESLVDLDDDSCDEAERCAAAIRGA